MANWPSSSENPPPEVTESAGQSSNAHFKGVRMRKWGKWVAEVRLPNSRKRIWLGSYDTPEKAARAYDAAVYCLRGPTATFNFPETPPDIPSAPNLSPLEIQAAAARFAHAQPAQTPASEVGSTEEEDAAEKAGGGAWTSMEAILNGPGEGSSNLEYFDPAFGEEYYIPVVAAEAAQEEEDSGEIYETVPGLWDF